MYQVSDIRIFELFFTLLYTLTNIEYYLVSIFLLTLREKGPNAELFLSRISVFSCIQFECSKIRTRNNSVFGQFSRSDMHWIWEYMVDHTHSAYATFSEKLIFFTL